MIDRAAHLEAENVVFTCTAAWHVGSQHGTIWDVRYCDTLPQKLIGRGHCIQLILNTLRVPQQDELRQLS